MAQIQEENRAIYIDTLAQTGRAAPPDFGCLQAGFVHALFETPLGKDLTA